MSDLFNEKAAQHSQCLADDMLGRMDNPTSSVLSESCGKDHMNEDDSTDNKVEHVAETISNLIQIQMDENEVGAMLEEAGFDPSHIDEIPLLVKEAAKHAIMEALGTSVEGLE